MVDNLEKRRLNSLEDIADSSDQSAEVSDSSKSLDLSESTLDAAVDAIGNVSEKLSERSSENKGASASSKSSSKQKSVNSSLKQRPVSKEVMISQIRKNIKEEIVVLRKDIEKLMKKGKNMNASELNIKVTKLRGLRSVLNLLFVAPLDKLRSLWNEWVQNS